ncbi:MAG: hypothetical protein GDA48_11875, partial [Hormoscilla sp. GM102CHS1]|nr:hypothetical protein [Hormoscilla sp. GM102CHS1]
MRFRAALIACEGDRRLVERTVVLVEKKGEFNSRSLKAALDSSERQATSTGRAKLRERVTVEHSLAHIGQWQGAS